MGTNNDYSPCPRCGKEVRLDGRRLASGLYTLLPRARETVPLVTARLNPIAERLTEEVASVTPWSARPAYAGEVKSWAWAEARCAVLRS
jgi:hypothetical protein